jgi:hypothetical protein
MPSLTPDQAREYATRIRLGEQLYWWSVGPGLYYKGERSPGDIVWGFKDRVTLMTAPWPHYVHWEDRVEIVLERLDALAEAE